jgi:HAD superfamily hydrolase (TIGR01509 family)
VSIRALIFDFDGLILDTETPEVDVWSEIYADHGFHMPFDLWAETIGGYGISNFNAAAHLNQLAGQSLDEAALQARYRVESDRRIRSNPVREGVMEYLTEAKRLHLRLAIASSSAHQWVDTHLARLGLLHYFDKIICSDDVPPGRTKPNPDLFLKALEHLQVHAREAIVFEDSPNGVKAANRAGILVVAVPNPLTSRLPIAGENLRLRSMQEMPLRTLLGLWEARETG